MSYRVITSDYKMQGGSEEPTGLTIGDFWWDSDDNQLYVYNGNEFILVEPQNAGTGITQMVSYEVLDNTGTSKSIIAAIVSDSVMFTISSEQFVLGSSQPSNVPLNLLEKFDIIRKGVTLADNFNRVVTYLGSLEKQLEQYREFYYAASELRRVSKKIDKWTKK